MLQILSGTNRKAARQRFPSSSVTRAVRLKGPHTESLPPHICVTHLCEPFREEEEGGKTYLYLRTLARSPQTPSSPPLKLVNKGHEIKSLVHYT